MEPLWSVEKERLNPPVLETLFRALVRNDYSQIGAVPDPLKWLKQMSHMILKRFWKQSEDFQICNWIRLKVQCVIFIAMCIIF